MLFDLLFIAGGLILLVAGAEGLVRGSVRVAVGMGMTPLIAGLTVAAFGTSSPELIVSLQAALAGSGALAVGNVIGSNICNVALILGISAVIRPLEVNTQVVRTDVPVMIVAAGVLIAMLWNGTLGRIEGLILVAALAAYMAWTIRVARSESSKNNAPREKATVFQYFLIVVGLILLVLGGSLFVRGASALARDLGVSEAVIGLTMVAVGTSLPELATSIIAAVRGQVDVAVGNVVGSNIFNIFGILGITALIAPLAVPNIGVREFAVLAVVSLVVLPIARTGFKLTRIEGGILLAGYIGYTVWLFAAGA